jgi:hypothetical protein
MGKESKKKLSHSLLLVTTKRSITLKRIARYTGGLSSEGQEAEITVNQISRLFFFLPHGDASIPRAGFPTASGKKRSAALRQCRPGGPSPPPAEIGLRRMPCGLQLKQW